MEVTVGTLGLTQSNKRVSLSFKRRVSRGVDCRGFVLRTLCQWFSVRLSPCWFHFFKSFFLGLHVTFMG